LLQDDDSSDDSSDGSDSSADEEEAAPSKKRKADDEEVAAPKKAKTEAPAANDTGVKNLFVGSLSWSIDEEWLAREFEEFGEITGCRVITDRETGRSKGYVHTDSSNSIL
jgi:nucleolin